MELREFVELVMHELEGFALVDGVVHFSVEHNVIQFSCIQENSQF